MTDFAGLNHERVAMLEALNAPGNDLSEEEANPLYARLWAAQEAILKGEPKTVSDIEVMLSAWIDIHGPASTRGSAAYEAECRYPEHATMFRIRDAVRAMSQPERV
jgi:hypothetical protein